MTLRRMTTLLAVCFLLVPVASAHAGIPFYVEGGVSDNYKAAFNADPSVRELRTWLSLDRIDAAGSTWTPTTPSAISFASPLAVASLDGRSGVLAVTSTSANVASVTLRVDPPKDNFGLRWGPLMTLRSPIGAGNAKARIGLSLTSGGAVIATGVLDYWTTTFSGTGSSIEANGPNGRWRVSGFPLDANWESGSTPSGSLAAVAPLAPRATGLTATRAGTTIRVRATARAAQGARVLFSRYRLGSGRSSAWRAASSPFAFRLAAGAKARVTVQVRDVRGFVSKPVVRIVG